MQVEILTRGAFFKCLQDPLSFFFKIPEAINFERWELGGREGRSQFNFKNTSDSSKLLVTKITGNSLCGNGA